MGAVHRQDQSGHAGRQGRRRYSTSARPNSSPAHDEVRDRWKRINEIERDEIGAVNHRIDVARLDVRKAELKHGQNSPAYKQEQERSEQVQAAARGEFERLSAEVQRLRAINERYSVTFVDIGGQREGRAAREYRARLSAERSQLRRKDRRLPVPVGRVPNRGAARSQYRRRRLPGDLWHARHDAADGDRGRTVRRDHRPLPARIRQAGPAGVVRAHLRQQSRRRAVDRLRRVRFGFFAYVLGGSIDSLFFPERLPNPTFGTGGLLWAALTLALLTVPVVIVATEEALAAVPRSMREGSLACGASKWQTIRNIVLPRALPGVMTGIILAMARGAGEVAPLMLVGVVKLAPGLPIDGVFPYIHLERSFMHLGFHIYDVGFQSRNSEAGKPMVFVTTVLLITMVAVMNAVAIVIRNRLKRRFAGSQF